MSRPALLPGPGTPGEATRIAVVGAGGMARRRALAFLATGRAQVCGIASRRAESARALGAEVGCAACFDDFRRLAETAPRAVLVEVPNAEQDRIVSWALEQGLHVLVGSFLACSTRAAAAVARSARARRLVVEAGFEARYKPAWEATRRMVAGGGIGRVVAVRTVALWDCAPGSWYASQRESGGMPLAHMTYAFVNPLRWIFGEPTHVSAFANRKRNTAPGAVDEETCVATLLFPDSVPCSMTAGFVKPFEDERDEKGWGVWIVGTRGGIELYPGEMGSGWLRVHRGAEVETVDFAAAPDAFRLQAEAFLASMDGERPCHNPPEETIGDIRVAEAIVESARTLQTVVLPGRQAPAPTLATETER